MTVFLDQVCIADTAGNRRDLVDFGHKLIPHTAVAQQHADRYSANGECVVMLQNQALLPRLMTCTWNAIRHVAGWPLD